MAGGRVLAAALTEALTEEVLAAVPGRVLAAVPGRVLAEGVRV
jgi:hypothetical protein